MTFGGMGGIPNISGAVGGGMGRAMGGIGKMGGAAMGGMKAMGNPMRGMAKMGGAVGNPMGGMGKAMGGISKMGGVGKIGGNPMQAMGRMGGNSIGGKIGGNPMQAMGGLKGGQPMGGLGQQIGGIKNGMIGQMSGLGGVKNNPMGNQMNSGGITGQAAGLGGLRNNMSQIGNQTGQGYVGGVPKLGASQMGGGSITGQAAGLGGVRNNMPQTGQGYVGGLPQLGTFQNGMPKFGGGMSQLSSQRGAPQMGGGMPFINQFTSNIQGGMPLAGAGNFMNASKQMMGGISNTTDGIKTPQTNIMNNSQMGGNAPGFDLQSKMLGNQNNSLPPIVNTIQGANGNIAGGGGILGGLTSPPKMLSNFTNWNNQNNFVGGTTGNYINKLDSLANNPAANIGDGKHVGGLVGNTAQNLLNFNNPTMNQLVGTGMVGSQLAGDAALNYGMGKTGQAALNKFNPINKGNLNELNPNTIAGKEDAARSTIQQGGNLNSQIRDNMKPILDMASKEGNSLYRDALGSRGSDLLNKYANGSITSQELDELITIMGT
jgi:hypothetical protein